ncbi:MAG: hypothetical protein HOP08_17330 [Cyclobacteriaceae bacterium]|nr:hypothetical protein [Cyclobacteriaceae bacterium]
MTRFIPCIAILIALTSCAQRELSEKEKQEVISSAREALDDYYRDIKKSGLTGELAHLDSSAEFFWTPPGYDHPISYDTVAHILRSAAPQYSLVENSFDTLRIIPLSRELASYSAKVRSRMVDTAGNVTNLHLIETGVLIRRNRWKLLHGQTSIIP